MLGLRSVFQELPEVDLNNPVVAEFYGEICTRGLQGEAAIRYAKTMKDVANLPMMDRLNRVVLSLDTTDAYNEDDAYVVRYNNSFETDKDMDAVVDKLYLKQIIDELRRTDKLELLILACEGDMAAIKEIRASPELRELVVDLCETPGAVEAMYKASV